MAEPKGGRLDGEVRCSRCQEIVGSTATSLLQDPSLGPVGDVGDDYFSLTVGTGTIASEVGAVAFGSGDTGIGDFGGTIVSAGTGSEASGLTDDVADSQIVSIGAGSKAFGSVSEEGEIMASSDGIISHGIAASGGAIGDFGESYGGEVGGAVDSVSQLFIADSPGGKALGQASGSGSFGSSFIGVYPLSASSVGAIATGSATDGTAIVANGNGALALGTTFDDAGTEEDPGQNFIQASSDGSVAAGSASGTGTDGQGTGSAIAVFEDSAGGCARGSAIDQGEITINTEAPGAEAAGSASGGGQISVGEGAAGAKAFGLADGAGSVIAANSPGAIAMGVVGVAGDSILATADGAFAHGAGALADQSNEVVFASGSHSQPGDAETLFLQLRAVTNSETASASLILGSAGPPALTQPNCGWTYELQIIGIAANSAVSPRIHSEFIRGAVVTDDTGAASIVNSTNRTSISSAGNHSTVSDPVADGNLLVVVVNSGGSPADSMRWYANLIVSQVVFPDDEPVLRIARNRGSRRPQLPDAVKNRRPPALPATPAMSHVPVKPAAASHMPAKPAAARAVGSRK